MKPTLNRILVKVDPGQEGKTKGGIIVPNTDHATAPQKGEVIAVGPGARNALNGKRIPMDYKKGQRVLFSRYGGHEAGNPAEHAADNLLVLNEEDVLAIL